MKRKPYETSDVLSVDTMERNGIAVIAVTGELDMITAETPLAEAVAVLEHAPAGLVVDLEAVSFFGSCGINMLLTLDELAQRQCVAFAVVASQHVVMRPLEMVGLNLVLPLFPNLPDAIEAVRNSAPSRPHQANGESNSRSAG